MSYVISALERMEDGVVRPVSSPLPSYSLFVPTNLCFFFSSTMVVAESGILVSNRFVALFQRAAGGGGTGYSTYTRSTCLLMHTHAPLCARVGGTGF